MRSINRLRRHRSLAVLVGALAFTSLAAFAACDDEPDNLGEAVEELGDEIEDAGDEIKDEIDDHS